jgi:hypothetical protein
MSLAAVPYDASHPSVPTRDRTCPTHAGDVTPLRMAPEAEGGGGPAAESAANASPEEPGVSGPGAECEHTRDILAIMMAILASHDGFASAKKTALLCWEEADKMARMMRGSRPDGNEERQVATPGIE